MKTEKFKHHALVMLCVLTVILAGGALTVYCLINESTRFYTIAAIAVTLGLSYWSSTDPKPETND